MYDKRIKIFVILIASLLLVCLMRLVQMQLLSGSFYRGRIAELKLLRGRSRQLKTIRGKILDRKDRILASDEPRFQLSISYELSCFLDQRVQEVKFLKAAAKTNPDLALANVRKKLEDKLQDLQQIVDKCAQFENAEPAQIEDQIRKINDFIWNQRAFQAWRTNFPDSKLLRQYDDVVSIPLSQALADFEKNVPDPVRRLELVKKIDIAEMHQTWPLVELQTDDDVFTAQLEFLDIDDIEISPRAHRLYPYGPVAAQTIGWVGRPQKKDKKLYEDDRLSSYLEDEVCGREDGVEYVCETLLRGRRGRLVHDIDHQIIERTETQFGTDIVITLDIKLQKRIEDSITDSLLNPNNYKAPTAAVVIDVQSADILALVSLPLFDLNRVRYDYGELIADPNEPLRNRALNKQYPPGSAVKPLILIAGLESGKITADEIIPCPAQKAPRHWPSCWIYNRYKVGHGGRWQNIARNAIRGSCNIYFSRLADRIDSLILQQWLLRFGYGLEVPLDTPNAQNQHNRNFRQVPGIISSRTPPGNAELDIEEFPINNNDRRLFGIGQSNLRVTPLQVASAFAAIARHGVYKPPRLFPPDPNDPDYDSVELNISQQTLDVVYDGMHAAVSEPSGTAVNQFRHSGLAEQGVTVYGKTGSTEKPDHAWFAGFARDDEERCIAIAVVVEGGQHGSSDAAPLAVDIIQFCIEEGYLGPPSDTTEDLWEATELQPVAQ